MINRFDSKEMFYSKMQSEGINLFTGAGFSVMAKDNYDRFLPVGNMLLEELKEAFPSISKFSSLSRACTLLEKTDREGFEEFISQRFSVGTYDAKYAILRELNINNIFSTNVDDLIYKIFEDSSKNYLITTMEEGTEVDKGNAVNYSPVHGCVRAPKQGYIFSKTNIASAFANNKEAWSNLRATISRMPIIFWGWSFDDSDAIEALYSGVNTAEKNDCKWILLRNPAEEETEFFEALGFNIIDGDTCDMLTLLNEWYNATGKVDDAEPYVLPEYIIPSSLRDVASYPLSSFFEGDVPRWSHILSDSVPRIKHFFTLREKIYKGENLFVIGIPASGKTTLIMQLMSHFNSERVVHFIKSPSYNEVRRYVKLLAGRKSLLFLDDAFRDYNAVLLLLRQTNIQLVCCDRDYVYERVVVWLHDYNSEIEPYDVSEIDDYDARKIIDSIPSDKRKKITTIKTDDSTIFSIINKNMKRSRFDLRFSQMINQFYDDNPVATELFVMVCYVHASGVPVSFDMIYSYLSDVTSDYDKVYSYIREVGKIIKECTEDSFSYLDINLNEQDYYQIRSRYFAEMILRNLPRDCDILAKVLMTFVENVPVFKICRFDVFKRNGYDARYALKAFSNIDDAGKYYEACLRLDNSEYIYQQAALYFKGKSEYSIAFKWIENARNLSKFNRFSIDNTHAIIQFYANCDKDEEGVEGLMKDSLDILRNCYTQDKRKMVHVYSFADLALKYAGRYGKSKSREYLELAQEWIKEILPTKELGNRKIEAFKNFNIEINRILVGTN